MLRVRVVRAAQLKDKDVSGTSDPYVVLRLVSNFELAPFPGSCPCVFACCALLHIVGVCELHCRLCSCLRSLPHAAPSRSLLAYLFVCLFARFGRFACACCVCLRQFEHHETVKHKLKDKHKAEHQLQKTHVVKNTLDPVWNEGLPLCNAHTHTHRERERETHTHTYTYTHTCTHTHTHTHTQELKGKSPQPRSSN